MHYYADDKIYDNQTMIGLNARIVQESNMHIILLNVLLGTITALGQENNQHFAIKCINQQFTFR